MAISVGIDLGTTNSVCCALINGTFHFLNFRGNESLLPSAILWRKGTLTVGEMARRQSVVYAENFIKSSKTFMGDFGKQWVIEGRIFSPTYVAIEILSYIRKEAERTFNTNGEITAVITVPHYFTSSQSKETKTAGERAGFNVKQIFREPMAAGIAYGFEDKLNEKIAVIDIGGGTFDVSILETEGNSYTTLAIDGDNKLGGDNFDEIILELCLKRIRRTAGIDLSSHDLRSGLSKDDFSQAKQRLVIEAERKKIELSRVEAITIDIPNLFKHRDYNFSIKISRKAFENAAKTLLRRIERKINNCLTESSIAPSKIDKVILVGGTSYIPIIQNDIRKLFNQNPYSDKDLSKLVAMGAAIIAVDEGIEPKDIISHSLGIELFDGTFYKILKRNKSYPISVTKIFPFPGRDPNKFVLNIFEGEDKFVINNAFYGRLELKGIADIRNGGARVKVTFAFDKNRDLHVTAKDMESGDQRSKTIKIAKGVNP